MHITAGNIAKSLEYFLHPQTISIGASIIAFPAFIAMGYFDFFKVPEVQWFHLIFIHLKRFGIDVGSLLDAVGDETNLSLVAP